MGFGATLLRKHRKLRFKTRCHFVCGGVRIFYWLQEAWLAEFEAQDVVDGVSEAQGEVVDGVDDSRQEAVADLH